MNRTIVLAGLFVLQAACCVYFVMDVFWHIFWPSRFNWLAESEPIEALVTFVLFLSLFFIASELMKMLRRQSKLDDQIKVASGAFTAVLEERFRDWALTSAEREVAILAIKRVFHRGNGRTARHQTRYDQGAMRFRLSQGRCCRPCPIFEYFLG